MLHLFEIYLWGVLYFLNTQAHVCEHVFQGIHVCLALRMVVMIAGIHISQEIFAIDMPHKNWAT